VSNLHAVEVRNPTQHLQHHPGELPLLRKCRLEVVGLTVVVAVMMRVTIGCDGGDDRV
jgi:hypothetical protein